MIAAEPQVLRCGVIGAGIAGLGVALALGNAGHEVEIFERSHFKNEVGAAITVAPNATLILNHWGFDQAAAKPTPLEQIRALHFQNLKVLFQDSFEEVPTKYPQGLNSYHRVDLHNGMRHLVEQQGANRIKLGSAVTKVDADAGIIEFADGSHVQKDLVVIADGMKSDLACEVLGPEKRAEKTGRSLFRALIPTERLMADENIRPLFEGQAPGYMAVPQMDKHNLFVIYPCRDNEIMSLGLFHNTHKHQDDADDWNSEASVDDVLKVLESYNPVWHDVIRKADSIKVYTVGFRSECSRLVRGKAIVLGDAAHPMLSTYVQGGGMALEDAAALEIMLSELKVGESVEKRLQLWEQLRVPRAATTQVISNGILLKGPETKEEIIARNYKGPLFKPLAAPAFSRPVRDFWYGYNIFEEATKALEYKDRAEGIPDGVLKPFGPF